MQDNTFYKSAHLKEGEMKGCSFYLLTDYCSSPHVYRLTAAIAAHQTNVILKDGSHCLGRSGVRGREVERITVTLTD